MAKAHPTNDEYNWEVYTKEYSGQVSEMEASKHHQGSDFLVRNWEIDGDKLIIHDNVHGNWSNIYSAIHRLKPESVFECGCGGMYHLQNISTIFPHIQVAGCDLLQSQIDFGRQKFGISDKVFNKVRALNFCESNPVIKVGRHDFVYSQAVVMHLSTQNALKFVRNMLKISKKHVYMIEGEQHDYAELVETVDGGNWSCVKPHYNCWLFTRKG